MNEVDLTNEENAGDEVQSKLYRVRVKTAGTEIEGLFHSTLPQKRLSEMLTRSEAFFNLKDAVDCVTKERFPFVVVHKNSIEVVKVLEELS